MGCLSPLSTPLLPCQLLAYFFFCLLPSKVEILVVWLVSVWENWAEVLQASLVAQMVKCLPAMRETQVRFLGWEDPLEKEMAIRSSSFAWKIPWMEDPDRLQSMGSQRVGPDWATSLHFTSLQAKRPRPCPVPPSYFLMHTFSRWSLLRAGPVNSHFLQSGLSRLEFSIPRFWIWNCWIGKEVRQGCILSPCLFNLYAEYIMRNTRLEEPQGGIKIVLEEISITSNMQMTPPLRQKVKRN